MGRGSNGSRRLRVAVVTGSRSATMMGLETAEARLLAALAAAGRDGVALDLRAVGGRGALRYARRIGARWVPAPRGRSSPLAWLGADLVHLVGLSLPPPSRTPFAATFHDLSPLHYDDEGELPRWARDVAARAARLVVPSRFTAGELEHRLGVPPDRIRVVPNGPGHDVSPDTPPLGDAELRALGLSTPFVLRMGGYTARKNVPLLLAAWPEVRRQSGASLALVGPPQDARALQLAAAPSLEGVVVLDYLPAELVPRLIRSAAVVASPSLYEGFGLPPLEAMAAGTPVVAVRTAFAEEVCGDAALLVADDAAVLAEALVRVLAEPALAEALSREGPRRAARFTWERSARMLLDVYAETA